MPTFLLPLTRLYPSHLPRVSFVLCVPIQIMSGNPQLDEVTSHSSRPLLGAVSLSYEHHFI